MTTVIVTTLTPLRPGMTATLVKRIAVSPQDPWHTETETPTIILPGCEGITFELGDNERIEVTEIATAIVIPTPRSLPSIDDVIAKLCVPKDPLPLDPKTSFVEKQDKGAQAVCDWSNRPSRDKP